MTPFKSFLTIGAALLVSPSLLLSAVLIDMGTGQGVPAAPDGNGNYWNTYIGSSGTLALITTGSTSSGWTMALTPGPSTGYSGAGINPAPTGAPADLAIAGAYNDGFFDSTPNTGLSVFSFSGLEANTEFTLTLWGYRGTAGNSNDGLIAFTVGTVEGGSSFTLVPTVALTVNVTSNGSGEIAFTFDSATGASGSKAAQINVMSLAAVPEPNVAAMIGFGSVGLLLWVRRRNSRLG